MPRNITWQKREIKRKDPERIAAKRLEIKKGVIKFKKIKKQYKNKQKGGRQMKTKPYVYVYTQVTHNINSI